MKPTVLPRFAELSDTLARRYGDRQPFVPDWGQGGADAWIPDTSSSLAIVFDYATHAPDVAAGTPDKPSPVRPNPLNLPGQASKCERCDASSAFGNFTIFPSKAFDSIR